MMQAVAVRLFSLPLIVAIVYSMGGRPGVAKALDQASIVAGCRPNIVLILSDDMGYGQPGFHGGNAELTPNMDRLAEQSLLLKQFYTHSVCAPTRAALLTGKYAFRTWSDWRSEDFGKPTYLQRLGLTLARNEAGDVTRRIHALDTSERTIAEALREAGYFTSIIGKWHCGEWLKEHLPMQQGFMHQYGHYAWGIDYNTFMIPHNAPAPFHVYDWHRNEQPVREQGYSTDLMELQPLDSIDMTETLFANAPSPRTEIIFEVSGSVRIPTVRDGDFKLMGDRLYNIASDPRETRTSLPTIPNWSSDYASDWSR